MSKTKAPYESSKVNQSKQATKQISTSQKMTVNSNEKVCTLQPEVQVGFDDENHCPQELSKETQDAYYDRNQVHHKRDIESQYKPDQTQATVPLTSESLSESHHLNSTPVSMKMATRLPFLSNGDPEPHSDYYGHTPKMSDKQIKEFIKPVFDKKHYIESSEGML
jgi:hypothetical protein